jgi:dTDP-4-dehydrorhamnose reductase
MRIVLTGISGQVGRALIGPLEGLGHVIPADRSLLNLAKPEELFEALDRLAPDLIINPAAYTAVDRAEDERDLAFTVNAEAPGAFARWAARNRVPLLHFSTDYVFDGKGETPWRETSQTGPLSVYGASKLAGEEAIRAAGGPHLIVRTSWVYAAEGANFLRTIARLARERTELKVVADQIGAPTSARSLAEGLASMLSETSGSKNEMARRFMAADGLIHVANSGETSWYGFACAIVDGLRSRNAELAVRKIVAISTREFPTKAVRPPNSRLEMSRLEGVFGIRMADWRDALELELDELVRSKAETIIR